MGNALTRGADQTDQRKAPVAPVAALAALSAAVQRELHARSGAVRWDVTLDAFSARLQRAVDSRFKEQTPPQREVDTFVAGLHLEDLALACACATGHEPAWEHFVRELRPSLYAAARHIAPGRGEELADSLFAELFGLDVRGGRRRSLLDYYHGRARLTTWLRTVLAQRHVDALRTAGRTVPLDDDAEDTMPAAPTAPLVDTRRGEYVAMVQQALDAAVQALEPRARLCLRLYYGEGVKLARIGRLTGEHEATISRKLDRARRDIRRHVEDALRTQFGLTAETIAECLELAAAGPELDVARLLTGDEP